MNTYHQELLAQIKKHAGNGNKWTISDSYFGSGHFHYQLSVPLKRTIAKTFANAHKDIFLQELTTLISLLFEAKSYEEKTIAGLLLGYFPKQRKALDIYCIDTWLEELNGWAEIDTLCQSNFTAREMLDRWDEWDQLIIKLSKSENISRRRASLVLLTQPVGQSNDERIITLSFAMIDQLKHEKDILITKAISWLLRSMIKQHKAQVAAYITKNKDVLPKVALRETTRKLATGRK